MPVRLPRPRVLVLAIVVGLVVLTGVRELGWLDFELGTSASRNSSSRWVQNEQQLTERGARIQYVDGDWSEEHVRFVANAEPPAVTVRLARYDVDGLTWTPFYKRAKVEYEIEITSSGPEVKGGVTGTVESTYRGVISHRAFHAQLRDKVRQQMRDSLLR